MNLGDKLAKLRNHYCPPFDLQDPLITVTSLEINDMLYAQLPSYRGFGGTLDNKGVFRLPLDGVYWLPSLDDMGRIIAWDWVDKKEYRVEMFDCENFAFWFKARVDGVFKLNNVAMVIDYSGGHGYNLFLTSDAKILLFEPQTDFYWFLGDHDFKGAYKLELAWLLL